MNRRIPRLAALAFLLLAACNTVQGMGEDMQAGAQSIQDAARKDDKSQQ